MHILIKLLPIGLFTALLVAAWVKVIEDYQMPKWFWITLGVILTLSHFLISVCLFALLWTMG